ncbi:pyridoxamine 5'-phosphate oxidase family protein [Streptomyces alkaliterrae]|uniref:Pyridoxamine 5'-phosphate oxidase n=1 Tax=Streptomyces alkaliterrae TaxID=2213162 RepID=A0A5P0YYS5_9ACTN|nr:pyridoxamine 5'-phosphate oxidase family protein [Streptomyces alkaliterrae]MBB1254725.1 pyridoxamine 5'-phosphate oxidase family protein [Streptomyces alkaliterrae]MBB1257513.1 pyridoxamine 5'-phosphate oxidase family protein [Streptomyces alkaliterrae]MQS05423.1 pyridoxamine 5'-phosphate oxidase [Streptomyces alkaliterrae]
MTTREHRPPRTGEQRRTDVLTRLEEDVDAWVATASPGGEQYMVPLSFVFHDGRLIMCTRHISGTARNIRAGSRSTIALGHTRDVVLIEAEAEQLAPDGLTPQAGAAFAAKVRWDPRGDEEYVFLRFLPRMLRAWREENELKGSVLMRDGVWRV